MDITWSATDEDVEELMAYVNLPADAERLSNDAVSLVASWLDKNPIPAASQPAASQSASHDTAAPATITEEIQV